MTRRLSTIAPDLVERLEREPEPRLRATAERVAVAALEATEVSDERIDRALAAVRGGHFGNSELRKAIKALADQFDEVAWVIQERMESGEADQEEYLAAFRRARAITSLWFALDGDAMTAAMEATYEARAATDESASGRDIVSDS